MMCVCVGAGIFSFGIFLAVAAHHTHTKLLHAHILASSSSREPFLECVATGCLLSPQHLKACFATAGTPPSRLKKDQPARRKHLFGLLFNIILSSSSSSYCEKLFFVTKIPQSKVKKLPQNFC
jgi:hypothetical protein